MLFIFILLLSIVIKYLFYYVYNININGYANRFIILFQPINVQDPFLFIVQSEL